MTRLAIVSTHPIQYNAPLFRELARRPGLAVKVFYGWAGTADQVDPEFGERIAWDVPLLDGYDWSLVPNRSRAPGTHHFRGLDNPGMIAAIEDWGADMVLVYGWANMTHLKVLRHFKGRRPVLFRGDSTLLSSTGSLAKRLMRLPVLRWVYRHVDLALYPGQRNREYLRACGVPDSRLAWMPHSIENDRFAADADSLERKAGQERLRLGIAPEAMAFLFAGKLVERKQPELLLGAFLEAATRHRDIHLVFAGTGTVEPRLRQMAAGADRVHFIGFRNQSAMPLTYRIGDVFVLPSSRETWGLAVNEAMACSRPVIVSDRVGCMPDLARGREYAMVFSSGNADALKASLEACAGGRQQGRYLGALASTEIQRWSIPAAADALLDAIAQRRSSTRSDPAAQTGWRRARA